MTTPIFVLVSNNSGGSSMSIYESDQAANDALWSTVAMDWEEYFPGTEIPDCGREVLSRLQSQPGFDDEYEIFEDLFLSKLDVFIANQTANGETEHAKTAYSRKTWREAVMNEETDLGYWAWVYEAQKFKN